MPGKLSKEDDNLKLSQIGLRLVLSTIVHPVEYAKFLMQIGYEPLPPHPTTTIFGTPALALPNIFQYIGYIKSVDGTTGCFRGLSAKLCANVVYGISLETVKESIHFENDFKSFVDEEELDPHLERRQKFVKNFVKDIAGYTVSVLTSHPFQVIAARMMAQFIGGETKYSTFVSSIKEIYHQNGVGGFYSGLTPRLIGDLLSVCITSSFTYVIHAYLTEDEEIQNYCSAIVAFLATAFTYPFHVVSNCMIVNNSGLTAGSPPQMPHYKSWLHCWKHLESTKQIKRGSSLFWRKYPMIQ